MINVSDINLGAVESRFADIIWKMEPVASPELVKIAAKELNWKKSTTYTVLKRLCEKGIFKNENAVVSSRLSREEFYSLQSERFVEEVFDGSLPAFLTAFTSKKQLGESELKYLRELIEQYRK